ncbi:CynX/NimT family MFS transporter [Algoriphagus sediminis]|uniref:MFS transporter n=1 Tax=Algoriphagus sediminis TaxID=3057113 RepID=A0ABT7YEJ1_9BACT|nr:MFS transporter [Algoriphagus sediminis]MDN3204938.1 MFS transporter [Algoriphagus sediminis]
MNSTKPGHFFLIAGIILVSLNLRTSIASVGPLIPFIREDLGMSNGLAGFLTTLPLLTFASFSLVAPKIGQRLGYGKAIFFGIALLAFGVVIRVIGDVSLLLIGTALTGVGIVIANVLLIPLIKIQLPQKLGLMTALMATMMSLSAAVAAGVSVPIAVDLDLGWRGSLASWVVLMLLALLVWIPQLRSKRSFRPNTIGGKNVWKSKLGWFVTLFMGSQSVIYFTFSTWLPDMLINRGWSPVEAGVISSVMQLFGLIGSYFAPSLIMRLKQQSTFTIGIGAFYIIAFGALLIEVECLTYLCLTVIGICMGASLSIGYVFISLRTSEDQTTSNLSAMVQSIGYYLAAIGPFLFGWSLDLFNNWDFLIWFMLIFTGLFIYFGYHSGQNKTI